MLRNIRSASSVFLSTLSLRRATHIPQRHLARLLISIHALLAESDSSSYSAYLEEGISIHALLAESDFASAGWLQVVYNFYPRSPCGERLFSPFGVYFDCIFLSTLSLRRATLRTLI